MQHYIIRDLQNCSFCHWTWEKPLTRLEIIKHFREIAKDGEISFSHFSLRIIADFWELEICPVDIPIVKCPHCECPMRKDKCPNCGKEWFCTI